MSHPSFALSILLASLAGSLLMVGTAKSQNGLHAWQFTAHHVGPSMAGELYAYQHDLQGRPHAVDTAAELQADSDADSASCPYNPDNSTAENTCEDPYEQYHHHCPYCGRTFYDFPPVEQPLEPSVPSPQPVVPDQPPCLTDAAQQSFGDEQAEENDSRPDSQSLSADDPAWDMNMLRSHHDALYDKVVYGDSGEPAETESLTDEETTENATIAEQTADTAGDSVESGDSWPAASDDDAYGYDDYRYDEYFEDAYGYEYDAYGYGDYRELLDEAAVDGRGQESSASHEETRLTEEVPWDESTAETDCHQQPYGTIVVRELREDAVGEPVADETTEEVYDSSYDYGYDYSYDDYDYSETWYDDARQETLRVAERPAETSSDVTATDVETVESESDHATSEYEYSEVEPSSGDYEYEYEYDYEYDYDYEYEYEYENGEGDKYRYGDDYKYEYDDAYGEGWYGEEPRAEDVSTSVSSSSAGTEVASPVSEAAEGPVCEAAGNPAASEASDVAYEAWYGDYGYLDAHDNWGYEPYTPEQPSVMTRQVSRLGAAVHETFVEGGQAVEGLLKDVRLEVQAATCGTGLEEAWYAAVEQHEQARASEPADAPPVNQCERPWEGSCPWYECECWYYE